MIKIIHFDDNLKVYLQKDDFEFSIKIRQNDNVIYHENIIITGNIAKSNIHRLIREIFFLGIIQGFQKAGIHEDNKFLIFDGKTRDFVPFEVILSEIVNDHQYIKKELEKIDIDKILKYLK